MDLSPEVLRIARRIAALPASTMRETVLLEHLTQSDTVHTFEFLSALISRARGGIPPFSVALDTFISLLDQQTLPYSDQAKIYLAAKDAGNTPLMLFFYSACGTPAAATARHEAERPLTLGHRKSLARGSDPLQLDRLLRAPEPTVVRNLLQNERVTEAQVVRLAARRPTDPDVQREIFGSLRWRSRYRVRRTLVFNSDTPVEVALRLLPFLTRPDLRRVANLSSLHNAVREAATAVAGWDGSCYPT